MEKKHLGTLAATALAGFMAAGPFASAATEVDGHICANNTCKGRSACGGHGNANGCHGQNECKGKGWLDYDNKEDCIANGGKWKKVAAKPSEPKKKQDEPAKDDVKKQG